MPIEEGPVSELAELRVGQGFDVHPFSDDPDRTLVLGGVAFDGPGLAGHSDADAVAHAVTDALLGAAGLGDIGQYYPDSDPAHAGADSMALLADAAAAVHAEGWTVANVDCTVVLEAPKLAPKRNLLPPLVGAIRRPNRAPLLLAEVVKLVDTLS